MVNHHCTLECRRAEVKHDSRVQLYLAICSCVNASIALKRKAAPKASLLMDLVLLLQSWSESITEYNSA